MRNLTTILFFMLLVSSCRKEFVEVPMDQAKPSLQKILRPGAVADSCKCWSEQIGNGPTSVWALHDPCFYKGHQPLIVIGDGEEGGGEIFGEVFRTSEGTAPYYNAITSDSLFVFRKQ